MHSDKSDLITKLCNSWIQNSKLPDGGLAFGPQTEKFRLRNNGIFFPQLSFEEIRAACIGLTNVLIHKGLNTIVDLDHYLLWAWLAELIMQDRIYFSFEEREIKELFESTFRIALSPQTLHGKPNNNINPIILSIINHHNIVLTYLSFPLLEGLLKKLCRPFVEYDGKVIKTFTVPKKKKPRTYAIGGKCSNIRDFLYLFYENIADPICQKDLIQLKEKLSTLTNGEDGFDIIAEWRNSALHGETSLPTIGGSILNLIALLILHSAKERYKDLRQNALRSSQMYSQMNIGQRPPWSFYPPF